MELTPQHKRQMLGTMLSGAFIIFFTGYSHVWSIYQPYIMDITGWTAAQTSLCFYLCNIFFVVGNILGGRMQDKLNPKVTLVVWGGIFAAGVLLCAFSLQGSPLMLYLAYGVLQGTGCGAVYAVVLSTAQKWFPARTGFASGVIITTNGLCAFVLAPVSRTLLEAGGPRLAFLVVGGVMILAWVLVSLLVVVPKPEWVQRAADGSKAVEYVGRQYTSGEMIRTKMFYLLLFTMLFGLMPYYILSPLSQSLQLEQGIASAVAVASVMAGSVLNACTRFVLPTLADKFGRVACVRTVLIVEFVAMMLLTVFRGYANTVAVVLLYMCFGGIMGNFPSLCSDIFGLQHSGENYGYVMIAVIAASFFSPAAAAGITGAGLPQTALFGFGWLCAVVAMLCLIALSKELKKVEK